jgi:hypothetical protein
VGIPSESDGVMAEGDPPPGAIRLVRSRAMRLVLLAVAIAAVVVLLFTTVFPWVEQRLENPTIGAAPAIEQPTH